MHRTRVSSGTDWEPRVDYSRAVRVGDTVHVSGTTATDEDGNVVAPEDACMQAKTALENVEDALTAADAALHHVVRTRLFVTDIERWEEIGDAHEAAFGDIRPATPMVEVQQLIESDLIVEIEAVAIVDS